MATKSQFTDAMPLLQNLLATGTDVNDIPSPGGSYVALNIRGTTATVAIQSPIDQKKFLYTGILGKDLTTEDGYQAAKICALNVLKQVNRYVNEDDLVGLNHVDIMYQCTQEWDEGPLVANGASDIFLQVLGEKGVHTRSIAGVFRLPRQFCVAIVASFTVKDGAVLQK
ncbi:MAG TPA: RidA family protein [Flavitalea sp.]|nr:RidA family protein [Flavitalea sp.]